VRDFRFGFTLATHRSQAELAQTCRTAEDYGYDVAVAVDHLGAGRSSPFLAALGAAHACERLRVGTYVINVGFWNPSMLAREVVTAMWLTGGRLELGLGTGLIKPEFDAAGIPWHSFEKRLEWLARTIDELQRLVAAEGDLDMPPLLVGGTGERALRLAAERADIVSIAGIHQVPGEPPGILRMSTAAEVDDQVAFVRAAAGDRAEQIELNNFVKLIEITEDRRATAESLVTSEDLYYKVQSAEHALETPFLLLGTEEQIARQILEHRERYGFSYITVQRPQMEVLGPVIARVRSLAGQVVPAAG
jgi:probable F420-dependent oxidoreductase